MGRKKITAEQEGLREKAWISIVARFHMIRDKYVFNKIRTVCEHIDKQFPETRVMEKEYIAILFEHYYDTVIAPQLLKD